MIVPLRRALAALARRRAELVAWRALGAALLACRDVEALLELQERARSLLGDRS